VAFSRKLQLRAEKSLGTKGFHSMFVKYVMSEIAAGSVLSLNHSWIREEYHEMESSKCNSFIPKKRGKRKAGKHIEHRT